MGDQVQELRDFGLEGMGVFGHGDEKLKNKKYNSKHNQIQVI